MLRYICHILLLLLLILFSTQVEAANYYVSTSGSDGNSGSLSNPLRTIDECADRVSAGDTCYIRGGTYSETITHPSNRDGTSSNPITFTNYNNENVYVKGSTSGNTYTWTISGDWIIIDGLNLKMHNCRLVGNGANILIYGSHVTVTNCNFHGTQWLHERQNCNSQEMGVIISGGDYAEVSYCSFSGLPFNGIKIKQGGSTNPPLYFYIHHNTYNNSFSNGISVEGQTSQMQYGLVEYNVFGESYVSDSAQMNGSYTQNADPENYGIWYRYNEFYRNAENGIDVKGTRYIVIEYNTIWGSEGNNDGPTDDQGNDVIAGPGISRGSNATAWDNIVRGNVVYDNHGGIGVYHRYWVYNNTVLNNSRSYDGPNSGITANNSYAGISSSWDDNAHYFNNIVGMHSRCDMKINPNGVDGGRVDYNMMVSGSWRNCRFLSGNYTFYTTISSWRSFLNSSGTEGAGAHSFVGNPHFIDVPNNVSGNPDNHDFGIGASSDARGAAGHVTRANGSGSNSTALIVDDPEGFSAGISYQNRVPGDKILVGSTEAQISSISYGANRLNLVSPISWSNNAPIYWCPEYTCPSSGVPDIGAKQYGSSGPGPTNPTLSNMAPDDEEVTPPTFNISAETDIDATVRYGDTQFERPYSSMTDMLSTGGTLHSHQIVMADTCSRTVDYTLKAYDGDDPEIVKAHYPMCDMPTRQPMQQGAVVTADSGNYDSATPLSNAFDNNIASPVGGPGTTSAWVELDFLQPWEIDWVFVFGNESGAWYCGSYSLYYKMNELDPWVASFEDQDCTYNGWVGRTFLTPATSLGIGRYWRVDFTAPASLEFRELHFLGDALGGVEPDPSGKLKFNDNTAFFNGKTWRFD